MICVFQEFEENDFMRLISSLSDNEMAIDDKSNGENESKDLYQPVSENI